MTSSVTAIRPTSRPTSSPVRGPLAFLPLLGQFASLLLAIGFVMIALNAMRIGLLTRFMGYLGIFTGVLVLFPIGSPVPVVQGFWLITLGYLLSGRWPTGVPPAWRSGRPEPWPSSQELREQRIRAAGGRRPHQAEADTGARGRRRRERGADAFDDVQAQAQATQVASRAVVRPRWGPHPP